MRIAAFLFAVVAAVIVGVWSWLGAAVEMPQVAAGGRLDCVSYAPFRGDQNPLGPGTMVEPRQIEEDLAQLKPLTSCIRTYSIDHGLDKIPEIAKRHGMKVLHGLWLSSLPELNRRQIATTIELANKFPDVIEAIIVGNEVLLRGEMSAPELARTIREVKAKVPMRVTYADVWEFWLRHRDVAAAVDFITVHILPYWEDHPIPVDQAARHVSLIRNQVVAAFPDKEIFLGEFGWPSAGRMREGALPSPVNAARVLQEVVAQGKRENYRVNLIEAYDQPWKRKLEGTVGGYWGLYDAYERKAKFELGRSGLQPSELALAGGGRHCLRRAGVWRRRRGVVAATAAVNAGLARRGGDRRGFRHPDRLDDPQRPDRKPVGDRLDPLIVVGGGRVRRADRRSDRDRDRRESAGFRARDRTPRRRAGRSGGVCARRAADRAGRAGGAGGARARVQPPLPRLPVHGADRRGRSVCRFDDSRADAQGHPRQCGNGGGRTAGVVRGLHRAERNLRQLAVAVVLRRPCRVGAQSFAGAGRARLTMSSAAARPARSVLCSTSPKPAAAIAIVIRKIDGRMRLSTAAASATHPNTL